MSISSHSFSLWHLMLISSNNDMIKKSFEIWLENNSFFYRKFPVRKLFCTKPAIVNMFSKLLLFIHDKLRVVIQQN